MKNNTDVSIKIWSFLMEEGEQSIDVITSHLAINKKHAYAAIKRMKDSGHITCAERDNPLYEKGVVYSRPTCNFFSAVPGDGPLEAAAKPKSSPKKSTTKARQDKPESGSKYLSDLDLAERYRVSRVTPWRWARKGAFPAPVKLGENCTRWKLSDVEAWEAAKEKES